MTNDNKETAIKQAAMMKRMLPFRIHFIFAHKQTPDFWEVSCSTTMARPNSLVRKGATVEVLQ